MSKIYTSYEEVTRAYKKVHKELWNLHVLWDGSKLDKVACLYEPFAPHGLIGWMGFYRYDDKNIHFPAVYNGLDWNLGWTDKNSATDVLRHEFGHALAHRYSKTLQEGGLFAAAFGGAHGTKSARGTNPADWKGRCVTEYAATATREDFAETFMLFVKHKGKIPAKFGKFPAIVKKWEAVREIVRRVGSEPK